MFHRPCNFITLFSMFYFVYVFSLSLSFFFFFLVFGNTAHFVKEKKSEIFLFLFRLISHIQLFTITCWLKLLFISLQFVQSSVSTLSGSLWSITTHYVGCCNRCQLLSRPFIFSANSAISKIISRKSFLKT